MGTLMKIVGERPLDAIMDQLAEVRKVKVQEAFEKASVKCKGGSGAAPRAMPPVKSKAPVKKSAPESALSEDGLLDEFNFPKPKAKPPARLLAKKPVTEDAADSDSSVVGEAPKPASKPPARLLAKKPAAGDVQDAGAPAESMGPSKAASKPPARLMVRVVILVCYVVLIFQIIASQESSSCCRGCCCCIIFQSCQDRCPRRPWTFRFFQI